MLRAASRSAWIASRKRCEPGRRRRRHQPRRPGSSVCSAIAARRLGLPGQAQRQKRGAQRRRIDRGAGLHAGRARRGSPGPGARPPTSAASPRSRSSAGSAVVRPSSAARSRSPSAAPAPGRRRRWRAAPRRAASGSGPAARRRRVRFAGEQQELDQRPARPSGGSAAGSRPRERAGIFRGQRHPQPARRQRRVGGERAPAPTSVAGRERRVERLDRARAVPDPARGRRLAGAVGGEEHRYAASRPTAPAARRRRRGCASARARRGRCAGRRAAARPAAAAGRPPRASGNRARVSGSGAGGSGSPSKMLRVEEARQQRLLSSRDRADLLAERQRDLGRVPVAAARQAEDPRRQRRRQRRVLAAAPRRAAAAWSSSSPTSNQRRKSSGVFGPARSISAPASSSAPISSSRSMRATSTGELGVRAPRRVGLGEQQAVEKRRAAGTPWSACARIRSPHLRRRVGTPERAGEAGLLRAGAVPPRRG